MTTMMNIHTSLPPPFHRITAGTFFTSAPLRWCDPSSSFRKYKNFAMPEARCQALL